jgi:hypothetical protein
VRCPARFGDQNIRIISILSITFTNTNSFLVINNRAPINANGLAYPWDQCSYNYVGPQTVGILPGLFAYRQVVGFYGGGIITVWDGID